MSSGPSLPAAPVRRFFDELPDRFVPMKPSEILERRTREDKGMAQFFAVRRDRRPGPVRTPVLRDLVDDRGPDAGLIAQNKHDRSTLT